MHNVVSCLNCKIMHENKSEKIVKEYFRSSGFDISRINSSTPGKTPDYFVSDQEDFFLVEVKSREEDENFNSLIENPNPGEESQEIGYTNTISGIIGKGVEQLAEYDPDNENLHLLWCFTADLFNSNLVARQFIHTAYGLKNIEGYDKNGNYFEASCFYFGYNDFFKHRNLDALVVYSHNKTILCLNPFSESIDRFKATDLYKAFKEDNFEVIDPKKLEEKGNCLFVNSNIDRKDTDAVLKHLVKKYQLKKVTAQNFKLFNLPV